MLEKSEERVKLLKKGVQKRKIEELYIKYNRLKIIHSPILFDFNETSLQSDIKSPETVVIPLPRIHHKTDGDENSMSSLVDA